MYEDVVPYAFNMADGSEYIEQKYGFEGTPSMCLAKTYGIDTQVKFLKEPKKPDKETQIMKMILKNLLNVINRRNKWRH